jgi:hypothetical protein
MKLWHCMANGLFGPFGDYILAATPAEARLKFYREHKCTPTRVVLERRVA